MRQVDYLKLSEQYASFLVAIGGVSITVLTLVLSFNPESARPELTAFLVAALIVATVSCFAGAHMMAETAAYITYFKERVSGERLFLLASTNIFIAIILVLFALMLLPTASGKVHEDYQDSIKLISVSVFAVVVIAAICWMARASIYRMPAPKGWRAIMPAVVLGALWIVGLCVYLIPHNWLLQASFIPIIFFTVVSLVYFTWTFKNGGEASNFDIFFFSSAIILTYISLVVAGIKTMFS